MLYLNQWLFTKIDYDNDYYIKDVLNEMFDHIINFINSQEEIEFDYTTDKTREKFYDHIHRYYYCKKSDNFEPYDIDMYDYFCDKFSQDIIDIYLSFKETSIRNNLSLFHQKGDCSLYVQDFLFSHVLIEDPYYDSDDESDTDTVENNIDINIDETYV